MSSNIPGGTEEEHSSSESGWTKYIGSPSSETLYSDEQEDIYNNKNKCEINNDNSDSDQESDDSMASDASSGRSHHKLPGKSSKQSHAGMDCYQKAASKYSSEEKLPKQVIKDQRSSKTDKKESVLKAKNAASHVSKVKQR
ncbi:hypothetical protein SLEP1_g47093 [Rubroshorea leprosula]|uniref:Uncharacterized protein n=1 Tax=Rubroshorea leprosula TaxID=152421 RepID=A0AAV5LPB7_9ROSI|nr:hypothetical protein SLEP1_g47093 [Rubroshorea leprosula]